jgi:hypothetical protein
MAKVWIVEKAVFGEIKEKLTAKPIKEWKRVPEYGYTDTRLEMIVKIMKASDPCLEKASDEFCKLHYQQAKRNKLGWLFYERIVQIEMMDLYWAPATRVEEMTKILKANS